MKKIFLLVALWVFTLPLFAQNAVNISGIVTDMNTGAPLGLYPVTIQSTDSIGGFLYYDLVYTNPNGFFQETMVLFPSIISGVVQISVVDCQQYTHMVSLPFGPGSMSLTTSFSICAAPQNCVAGFSYLPVGMNTIHFVNQSVGGNGIIAWDFGDGTTSGMYSPDHTYPSPGTYMVSLTIGALGTTCWDQEIMTVIVDDSVYTGCQSYFIPETDPTVFGLVHFSNQSTGSLGTYTWNFGDGTDTTVQSTGNPGMDHLYATPGVYNVCLNVIGTNNQCYDSYCTTVVVDTNFSQCQAGFTYTSVPGYPPNTFQFYDLSFSMDSISSWTWFFDDPASGTANSSILQNPVFTFLSPGLHNVCLTITSGNCANTFCLPIEIGQPQGCQAGFNYFPTPGMFNTMQFGDNSLGNVQTWTWDFGDGVTQTMNFPGNPGVSHTYAASGVYSVCLSIVTFDSCSSTFCTAVPVGDSITGCQALFTYMIDSLSGGNVVHFTDISSGNPTQWLWNFGDGTSSTLQNPTHTFLVSGGATTYFVSLSISGLNCSSFCQFLVTVTGGQGCQAAFTYQVIPGNSPNQVQFTDMSSFIGIDMTWIWDFGDGLTQTITYPGNPDVLHTYQAPGFYNVCLSILGEYGLCSSTVCHIVPVNDSLPSCQAQFTYVPDTTGSGHQIHFIDLSMGNPTSWYWDFGDPNSGNANYSYEQNPSHVYSASGSYSACLTISGPNCQSVWCGTVEVNAVANCLNYFTYNQIGNSVNFQGYLLNGLNGTYAWDFGDNFTGTGQNVVHGYNSPGTYFVTLTTTASNGCVYSSTNIVSVGDTTLWSQLYGQVFAGNFPATQGMVILFSIDTNNNYVPFVDISLLDSAGVYFFPMVPQGNYVIYAIPFENGYLPTYYGNVLNWQNATAVQLGNPNNPYNINLLQSSGNPGGNGTIGGQVSQGDYSGSMVDKITMLLKDSNGNTILYSQVDPTGTFTFPQLAYGTYYLYAELAGCETQAILVVISEANPTVQVNLTLNGNSITGVNDKLISLDAGIVYPNPVKNEAQITVRLNDATDLYVELYAMTGNLLYSVTEPVISGETTIVIPAAQLADGIYLLKLYTKSGSMLTRKLVKTK